MAKTRAQRKAEQRKRQAQQQAAGREQSEAQYRTQVPESADVVEAELAEQGADLDALKGEPGATPSSEPVEELLAPAPSRAEAAPSRTPVAPPAEGDDKISRRARKQEERERRERAKASEARRRPREEPVERQRGRVIAFFISCWAELKRVQWPDRQTLIQASAVTLVFIAVMAAYLGALDATFNWLVQRIL